MRRLLTAVGAVAAAVVVGAGLAAGMAGPALAHSELTSSSPAPGQEVAPGLSLVALTFDGLRDGAPGTISLTGPDRAPVPVGEPVLVGGETLCAAVAPLATGVHALAYEATSRDGDAVTGRFEFEVTESGDVAGDPEACRGVALPRPAAAEGDAGSGAGWLTWLAASAGLAALLAALVGGGLVVRARRRVR